MITPDPSDRLSAAPSVEGVPPEEGLDSHEVAEAVERDPEGQRNHTDPEKQPDDTDTAPGRRGTDAHLRDS